MAFMVRQQASSSGTWQSSERQWRTRVFYRLQKKYQRTRELLLLKRHSKCCLKVAVRRRNALVLCFTFKSQHRIQEISLLLSEMPGWVPRPDGLHFSHADSHPHLDVLFSWTWRAYTQLSDCKTYMLLVIYKEYLFFLLYLYYIVINVHLML